MKYPVKLRKKAPGGGTLRERYTLFIPIIPDPASSVDVKGMVTRREVIQLAGCAYDLLYPRITEFDDIPRIHIDEVIVLHALIGLLKLCNVFPELMFDDQVAIEQQFNGVV